MEILTQKEDKILRAIKRFFEMHQAMPTVREIRDEVKKLGLSLTSLGAIFRYLTSLEKKGYITRPKDKKRRGISLIGGGLNAFRQVPIFGTISAGAPTFFAEQNIEGYLKVSTRLLKHENVFGLRVSGDSMNLAEVNGTKIEDGDFVLIDPDIQRYEDGDKVAVIVDGVATVKLFQRMSLRQIGLFPRSSNIKHKPIYLTPEDDFIIKGKVVGVLKHFR